jgi:hypothetical protein
MPRYPHRTGLKQLRQQLKERGYYGVLPRPGNKISLNPSIVFGSPVV